LQLDFPLGEQHPILSFEAPVILLDIDQMDISKLILILRKCLDGILHEHLPIGLIHYHNPRIVDSILLCMRLFPEQIVIDSILVVFVVVVDVLP
jgi:hypothetical protein